MLNFEEELSQEETDRLIEKIATDVVRRRLETPAVMFLEMHKPLSFIASQALLVGTPALGALFGAETMSRYSGLLRRRENVEKLIQKIEQLSKEKDKSTAGASGEEGED
ncbi:MAG: hypothetical protein Q7N50_15370 [Armatimonadota bacterium]|nr:hypothetical protein [Armatimonadota bacterium]